MAGVSVEPAAPRLIARYPESMPGTPPQRARARHWSKLACAIGLLFASLPLVCRLLFGGWDFEGAAEIGAVFLIAAAYFYVVSRRMPHYRDAASMFDQAAELVASGRIESAVSLLSKTIRQNPRVWQAYQYRGQLYLQLGDHARAVEDFEAAIQLAPEEPALRALHDLARRQAC